MQRKAIVFCLCTYSVLSHSIYNYVHMLHTTVHLFCVCVDNM